MTILVMSDITACYSNPSKAKQELGWQAEKDLKTMMQDAWRWQKAIS